MTKEIQLTQGKVALVDDEDFDRLTQMKWNAHEHHGNWYAKSNPGYKTNIKMHRFIMDAPVDVQVDHINGDGLDNRRDNLRFCTHAENMRNSKSHKDNPAGYKGVYWNSQRKTFQAYITINKKHTYLGSFSVPEDAARAYDNSAKKHHGEFARLNLPD